MSSPNRPGVANPFNGVDVGGASAPSFVDLDSDGDMDAVVGSEAGTLRSFRNNGTGVFTELTGAANPFDGVVVNAYSKPSFADIDGDGDSDMVVGDWYGRVSGFLNDGAGVFTEQVRRGYSATEYTDQFGGTSASAPVVSGVIALMLQVNPGLGWRDVQDNDAFVFSSALAVGNADRINDFDVAGERFKLDDSVFSGLATGMLAASALAANLTGVATNALHRIVYETDSGKIYFYADGNGGTARIHFATVAASMGLTNSDFFVV